VSPLQFITIIVTVVFIFFGIDLYKRQKMNLLHFLAFSFGGGIIILFAVNIELLDKFGSFFWAARGADVFIYIGIVCLSYLYIDLFNKHTKDRQELTKLLSQSTIQSTYDLYQKNIKERKNTNPKDEYIFLIRAHNEASKIWQVIDEIVNSGYHKILIIDDWSTDNTQEIIKNKSKKYWNSLLMMWIHSINRWWWAANQTLYNFVRKYWKDLKITRWVTFDADWQMNIQDMELFQKEINKISKTNKKIDLLVWSRFVNWAKTENQPKLRKIILKLSQLATLLFYNIKISDPHIWFRVIKLKTFSKLEITADGMHYANEINEQIRKKKLKFIEVPVKQIKKLFTILNKP